MMIPQPIIKFTVRQPLIDSSSPGVGSAQPTVVNIPGIGPVPVGTSFFLFGQTALRLKDVLQNNPMNDLLCEISQQENAPSAGFTFNPEAGDLPLTVSFYDTSTNEPGYWLWDFGDGDHSTLQNPIHTYRNEGTYSVTLTVINSVGTTSITQANAITAHSSVIPIVAAFSGTPTSGTTPLSVAFTDASTGSPTSWAWDFGDGNTSTSQNPSHTYSVAGTYSVTLTASKTGSSNSVTISSYVTAITPVVAAFSGTPTSGTIPLSVTFTDSSTGSPTSWSWDFGDGNTSTSQNPSHSYAVAGTYSVTLTASKSGSSDSVTRSSYVTAAFDPTSLSGLAFYGDTLTSNTLYTTTTATTLATTDGQNVQRWGGVSGSPVAALVKGPRAALVYRTENGVPTLAADTDIGPSLKYDLPSAPVAVTKFTAYYLARNTNISTSPNNLGAFGSGETIPGFSTQANSLAYQTASGFTTTQYAGHVSHHDLQWHVYAFVYDGTTGTPGTLSFCDGACNSSMDPLADIKPQAGPASVNMSMYSVGKINGNSCLQRFAAVGYYTEAHTTQQVRDMTDYLKNRFSALFSSNSTSVVTFIGASLFSINSPVAVPQIMRTNSTKSYDVRLQVRGGSTSVYLENRLSEDAIQLIKGRTGARVAVLYPGGNDPTIANLTPTQQYNYQVSMAATLRAGGYTKIVGMTNLPRSNYNNTDRASFNTMQRAAVISNGGSVYDALIDWANDPTMGFDGANDETVTNWNTDKIHPRTAGSAILGGSTHSAVIDSVLP